MSRTILFFNSDEEHGFAYWPLHDGDIHEPAGVDDFTELSGGLIKELRAWTELFAANFHPETGWKNGFDHAAYLRHGQALAARVQAELGDTADVRFVEADRSAWEEPYRTMIHGEEWIVRHRVYDRGAYDFRWVSHPHGYGFGTGLHPRTDRLSPEQMEEAIRDFLSMVDPETGYLSDDADDELRDPSKPPLGWPPQ